MFGHLLILCVGATQWLSFGLQVDESTADLPVVVKGVAGQSASLPCHIDQAQCGEVYFLTWTKLERDDRWSRIYIFADNVEKPLRDLSGRARFSLQKTEAQLSINQLKSTDEALYKCDVTYVGGKCPSLTFVRLNIIVKPSKAYIEYKSSQLDSGQEIRGLEDEFVRLACIVIGGKPMPVISWRAIDSQGNAKLVDIKNSSAIDDNMTRLVLTKQLSRNDLKSRYECHVQHEAIRNNSMDSHVMIDVSVGAKTIEIVGPRDAIKEGDIALIQCIAYGSKPETQIVWKNGTHIIDKEVKSEVEANIDGLTVNTRSYLEMRVTRFDHLNHIECHAINKAMKEPINESIELKIQYPPIVVMEPKHGVIVNESVDMVNIYCTFSSNPPELLENETKWFKDSQMLDIIEDNSSQHFVSSLSGYPILTIVNPQRNDSGAYYCSVSNEIGVGKPAEPILLTVLYPPKVNLEIYPNPEQGFTIKEGDDVRMICDIIDGNPLNASTVKWLKNGRQLVSELSGERTNQKEITWLSVTRTIAGNYTCLAVSEAGQSEPSNSIQIDISYPPSKAVIRQLNGIYAVKGHNLSLECIVSDLGKPSNTIEYHWESPDGVPFQTKESILVLTDLKLTNSGNITCAAVNEVGLGSKGVFPVTMLAPPKIIDHLPSTIGVDENKINKQRSSEVVTADTSDHSLSVNCRVECFPICQLSWYRNSQLIDNSTDLYTIKNSIHPEEVILNQCVSVVSTLIFNLTAMAPIDRIRDTNVIYSCVSSDNTVGHSVKSQTKFIVEYPPENLRVRPKRVDVIEYDIPPEISCESDALPLASYRWLSSSNLDTVIADKPLLSLNTSIQRERAGTYTCVASNRHGEDKIDLLINVLYAPSCVLSEGPVSSDGEIELICAVTSANPNNELIYNWSLNNSSLNESLIERYVKYEGLKSKLIIPISEESLFGSWSCSVVNSIGQTDPNCTLYVTPPTLISDGVLGDESVLLISTIIIAIIITFIVILFVLICLMRRGRHKQETTRVSQTRENPDGSRSPTPSSLSSHLSSNQVITYKKVEMNPRLKRNDKVMDISRNESLGNRKTSIDNENDTNPESPNREMYENMAFQRKCLQYMPKYQYNENIAQITRELRRTQSARYQTSSANIYSIYERNVVYADLQLTSDDDNVMNSPYNGCHTKINGNQHQLQENHSRRMLNSRQSNYSTLNSHHNSHNNHNNKSHINSNHHNSNGNNNNLCEYAVLTFDSSPSPPSIC